MQRSELSRRQLGLSLVGLAGLGGCGLVRERPDPEPEVPAEQILAFYEAGERAGVESLMPGGRQVAITGLTFHDWAYPHPDLVETQQPNPAAWRQVCSRDAEGGPTHHGIKLRLPGAFDEEQLHRSGPKLIAFLPYTELRAASLLKQAYRERFELICKVSWIGVLDSKVWAEGQVIEDAMAGLYLHSVRRVS